jgi:hypothetical protein
VYSRKRKQDCTYIIPAPAGATHLNKDMKVVAIPFAAPLCPCGWKMWSCFYISEFEYTFFPCVETGTVFK